MKRLALLLLPLLIVGCASWAQHDQDKLYAHIGVACAQLQMAGIDARVEDFDVEVWDGPVPFMSPLGIPCYCYSIGQPGARQKLVASAETPQRALTEEIMLLTAKHYGVKSHE